MSVENWIDAVCKLWEVSNGKGGTVRSFRVYEKNEFPESISEAPCALTYTHEVISYYSAGNAYELWNGVTEFHLTDGVAKDKFPEIMLYFARIRNAAAASLKLGGLVENFRLRTPETGGASIQGPVQLQYGSESPHHGLLVYWRVKEMVNDLTVSV